jgi:hypothetical protein
MVAKHSMEWFDTRPFGKPSGYLLVRGGYCIWAWVKVSNSRKHWLISDPLDWVRLRAFKVPSAPGRCLLFCGFLFLEGLWTPPKLFNPGTPDFKGQSSNSLLCLKGDDYQPRQRSCSIIGVDVNEILQETDEVWSNVATPWIVPF